MFPMFLEKLTAITFPESPTSNNRSMTQNGPLLDRRVLDNYVPTS